MTHLFAKIHENFINKEWINNPETAESLLNDRKEILPLLSTIEYNALAKEFNYDNNKIKTFLAFINRDYIEVEKELNLLTQNILI